MIMKIDHHIVGCFADQCSEKVAHSKNAIVYIIDIRREYLYSFQIIKEGGKPRPGYNRDLYIRMGLHQGANNR